MKPSYLLLRRLYPRTDSREALFGELGWNDLTNNMAYWNTCAIRMSVGLLRAGISLPGARMQAKMGSIKGRWIERGQAKLSNILKRLWGQPEVYRNEKAARAGIGQRNGVISFFRIEGGDGGHIDLVSMGDHGFLDCARSCFFSAREVWFWPLR